MRKSSEQGKVRAGDRTREMGVEEGEYGDANNVWGGMKIVCRIYDLWEELESSKWE